jgi:hypothetical protein
VIAGAGRSCVLRWLCVGLVACASGRAWSQSPPASPADEPVSLPGAAELEATEIPPALAAIVDRLGDPSYAAREDATAELLHGPFENAELYAVLAQRTLMTEQRHRLLSVVTERLLNTPRGAVGIKVDSRWQQRNQIVVEELLPGLPAREVLQVGDRITHLQGRPLENWDAFVDTVQSSVPGAKITMTVERVVSGRRPERRDVADEAPEPQYERIEIELELGSADRLLDPATGRPQRGGPVVRRREREADLAMMRFGGMPRLLQINGP